MKSHRKFLILYFIFFIIVILLLRFLDLLLMWELIVKEFKYQQLDFDASKTKSIFLGFSNYKKGKETLIKNRDKTKEFIIISYFDLIHPCVFLIDNENSAIPLAFVYLNIKAEKGIIELRIFKFDLIQIKQQNKTKNIIVPVLDSLLTRLYLMKPYEISDYHLDFSKCLKSIYGFYFYLPLISILLLSFLWTKKLMISLLYFLEMPLLFSLKLFLSSISFPFIYCINKFFNANINNTFDSPVGLFTIFLISPLVYLLFLKGILHGWKMSQKEGLSLKEKFVILFFLFLPIFLRF